MLEKNDLQQIGQLLDHKLDPIKQQYNSIELEIEDIKRTLSRIDKRSDEYVTASYQEIEDLKRRISELENELRTLKTASA